MGKQQRWLRRYMQCSISREPKTIKKLARLDANRDKRFSILLTQVKRFLYDEYCSYEEHNKHQVLHGYVDTLQYMWCAIITNCHVKPFHSHAGLVGTQWPRSIEHGHCFWISWMKQARHLLPMQMQYIALHRMWCPCHHAIVNASFREFTSRCSQSSDAQHIGVICTETAIYAW